MKLVYVAGAYNADTHWEIEQNIWRAREAGARVVQCGAFPVVPHANTAHYGGLADEQFFYAGTLALLESCHGILMLPKWEKSTVATREHKRARNLGLPVFEAIISTDWDALTKWAADPGRPVDHTALWRALSYVVGSCCETCGHATVTKRPEVDVWCLTLERPVNRHFGCKGHEPRMMPLADRVPDPVERSR